jgi:polyhydroxyalkanoate synthesis regulator phasin
MVFSVGSILVLQEKAGEFVKQAMEKGQEAENEGKKMVHDMRAQRANREIGRADLPDAPINATLERLNVPTETEIRELSEKITELSESIDELTTASQS